MKEGNLERLLGPEVVHTGEEDPPGRRPQWRVVPREEAQIKDVLEWATREKVAVYPRGGGTRWGKALRPFTGGVTLDMRGLDTLVELDAENLTVVARAGVTHRALQHALAPYGLFLPAESSWADRSTLGGEVASDASGPRKYLYGSVRTYLLGCRALFPNGSGGLFGGKQVKNVSGYDVSRWLCGSWGRLGVITELVLKVRPQPERRLVCWARCDLGQALAWAEEVRVGLYGVAAIEVLGGRAARLVSGERGGAASVEAGPAEAVRDAAVLAVGLEGAAEAVEWQLERLQEMAEEKGCLLHTVGEPDAVVAWWERRHSLFEVCRQEGATVFDLAVPPAALPATIAEIGPAAFALAAHAGNGHAHLFLCDVDTAVLERLSQAVRSRGGHFVCGDAAQVGSGAGVLTGRGAGALAGGGMGAVYRRIKDLLDPSHIMSPAGERNDL